MDEHELSDLFRVAPGDPPPPTFDLDDVIAASARARARRRTALITATACVVVALAAFGVSRLPFTDTAVSSTSHLALGQRGDASGRLPNASTAPSLQGSGGTGEDGPRAESTSGCEKVDRELATALAGELPDTGVSGPEPGQVCPVGSRSAAFRVIDGDRRGVVSVALAPQGTTVTLDLGGATARETTSSGGAIIVSSTPDPGSAPPLPADLDRIARALATRF